MNDRRARGSKALSADDKDRNEYYDDDRDRGGVDHSLRNDRGLRIIATCRVLQTTAPC